MLRHPILTSHIDAKQFHEVQTKSQQKPHYLGGSEVGLHLAMNTMMNKKIEEMKKQVEK